MEHPDKPRDPAPVPPSPYLGFSSTPIATTYTFGPPPPAKPLSYNTFTSPPVIVPTKPTPAKPANNPKGIIPYAPPHPQAHLIVAQVQRINPQYRARIEAQKFAQQQAFLARQKSLQSRPLGPALYGPQRTPQGYVLKPPGYIAPRPAHYYNRYYASNQRPNLVNNAFIRTRLPFQPAVRWNGFYPNALYSPYHYMRTLGRRELLTKSYQRPKHNRLSKLRKKWRKKAH